MFHPRHFDPDFAAQKYVIGQFRSRMPSRIQSRHGAKTSVYDALFASYSASLAGASPQQIVAALTISFGFSAVALT